MQVSDCRFEVGSAQVLVRRVLHYVHFNLVSAPY